MGYSSGIENTIPYENSVIATKHSSLYQPRSINECCKVVKSSDLEPHIESKSYVHMQDPSVLFFTMNMNIFRFYLIIP